MWEPKRVNTAAAERGLAGRGKPKTRIDKKTWRCYNDDKKTMQGAKHEKEEILEMSRRENGRRDLAELETAAQAGNIAGRVGAGLCCLLSAVIVRTAGVMPVSPWVIFSAFSARIIW